MQDFVAIDFETANGRRSSVCSVGIVVRGPTIIHTGLPRFTVSLAVIQTVSQPFLKYGRK